VIWIAECGVSRLTWNTASSARAKSLWHQVSGWKIFSHKLFIVAFLIVPLSTIPVLGSATSNIALQSSGTIVYQSSPSPSPSPSTYPSPPPSGSNLAVMPTFWENTGWGIGSTIDGGAASSMDTYPVAYGGQTCIQMSPNAYYISTRDGGGVADCEMDGEYTSVNVGDQIVFSAYIWTGSSTVGDNGNALLGGRIALDFYGAKGRICEIATPTGIPSYPNYPASMAQCTVSPNSNGWVKVSLDFTVQSQYEADPWGGYTGGTMATPTAFIPWFAWYSSNISAETAHMYIYDTELYIIP